MVIAETDYIIINNNYSSLVEIPRSVLVRYIVPIYYTYNALSKLEIDRNVLNRGTVALFKIVVSVSVKNIY